MRIMVLALTIAFLTACGGKKHEEQSTENTDSFAQVQEKFLLYSTLSSQARDQATGWVGLQGCDALLFSGLYASARGVEGVKLTLAEESPGKWQRRPLALPCYPGESATSISRDMLLGMMWAAWRGKHLDWLTRLADYAKAHNFVMGEPWPEGADRVLLSGNLLGLLHLAIYELSHGSLANPLRFIPPVYTKGLTGYQAHLEVLSIVLRGEVTEAIRKWGEPQGEEPPLGSYPPEPLGLLDVTDDQLAILNAHAGREPQNPLFQMAQAIYSGLYEYPAKMLLKEDHWPADRLPSKAEHCAFWPMERNYGQDWAPCGRPEEIHSGADWLFVADLLLRRVKP